MWFRRIGRVVEWKISWTIRFGAFKKLFWILIWPRNRSMPFLPFLGFDIFHFTDFSLILRREDWKDEIEISVSSRLFFGWKTIEKFLAWPDQSFSAIKFSRTEQNNIKTWLKSKLNSFYLQLLIILWHYRVFIWYFKYNRNDW